MSAHTNDSRELELFISNDGGLYRRQTCPIIENLARKMAKGVYVHEKALTLWTHLATNGAREYGKQFGNGERDGMNMFDMATRKQAAAMLSESYDQDVKDAAAQFKAEAENKKNWPLSAIRAASTGHFFDRDTMKYHGETMACFGVRYQGSMIIVYRKKAGTIAGKYANMKARWQFIPETGDMRILPDSE